MKKFHHHHHHHHGHPSGSGHGSGSSAPKFLFDKTEETADYTKTTYIAEMKEVKSEDETERTKYLRSYKLAK